MQSHIDSDNYESITDTLTITCLEDGTFDKNINDYSCTKVCPYPTNPDEEIFEISMNITSEPKPEIFDTVDYHCKDDTKKLVSKLAFETAEPTNQFDKLTSTCLISGWLNETIGSFTCTLDCEAPQNYTDIFNYNFNPGDPTTIGAIVK